MNTIFFGANVSFVIKFYFYKAIRSTVYSMSNRSWQRFFTRHRLFQLMRRLVTNKIYWNGPKGYICSQSLLSSLNLPIATLQIKQWIVLSNHKLLLFLQQMLIYIQSQLSDGGTVRFCSKGQRFKVLLFKMTILNLNLLTIWPPLSINSHSRLWWIFWSYCLQFQINPSDWLSIPSYLSVLRHLMAPLWQINKFLYVTMFENSLSKDDYSTVIYNID